MDFVRNRRVFNLVQFIFNGYVSEEHKYLLLSKYKLLSSFEEVIMELVLDVYRTYSSNVKNMDFYLNYLSNKYLDSIPLDELKRDILDRLESNYEHSSVSLEENHNILKESLKFICNELNKRNIDYYVLGSVPAYIKLNLPFSRFHSDIDIAINSEYIDQLKDIFKDSNYTFINNRLCSQKFFDFEEKRARGGHEIVAQCNNNDFCIGFYEFDRREDGAITKKDYFSEVSEGKLINRVCKYVYSKEFTDLYYSKDFIDYDGVKFRYCNIEGVYLLKKKNYNNINRRKDLYDINLIEKNYKLNEELINKMNLLIQESANYIIEDI